MHWTSVLSTFVSIGNAKQPFPRLLNRIALNASALPQPVLIQNGHTPFRDDRVRSQDFMDMDEFSQRMRDAELVIIHAGVGSVYHAIHAGKIPVVVPRRAPLGEHLDDHQLEWARALGSLERVVCVEDLDQLLAATKLAGELQKSCAMTSKSEPEIFRHLRGILAGVST